MRSFERFLIVVLAAGSLAVWGDAAAQERSPAESVNDLGRLLDGLTLSNVQGRLQAREQRIQACAVAARQEIFDAIEVRWARELRGIANGLALARAYSRLQRENSQQLEAAKTYAIQNNPQAFREALQAFIRGDMAATNEGARWHARNVSTLTGTPSELLEGSADMVNPRSPRNPNAWDDSAGVCKLVSDRALDTLTARCPADLGPRVHRFVSTPFASATDRNVCVVFDQIATGVFW